MNDGHVYTEPEQAPADNWETDQAAARYEEALTRHW